VVGAVYVKPTPVTTAFPQLSGLVVIVPAVHVIARLTPPEFGPLGVTVTVPEFWLMARAVGIVVMLNDSEFARVITVFPGGDRPHAPLTV
jgi:hypothetical protein